MRFGGFDLGEKVFWVFWGGVKSASVQRSRTLVGRPSSKHWTLAAGIASQPHLTMEGKQAKDSLTGWKVEDNDYIQSCIKKC